MVIGTAFICGSVGCTTFESPYVPGALQPIGSPPADVEKMNFCDLVTAQAAPSASALRGFASRLAGKPVATARSPMQPAPSRNERSALRREMAMAFSLHSDREERGCETRHDKRRLQRIRLGVAALDRAVVVSP